MGAGGLIPHPAVIMPEAGGVVMAAPETLVLSTPSRTHPYQVRAWALAGRLGGDRGGRFR